MNTDLIGRIALAAALGYVLGSIPVAWLVTKAITGKDLRSVGSGNVGVMNVALSVHRWAGLIVLAAEAAKGVLAVAMARALGGGGAVTLSAVLATVIGTRWMIWLRGAGGRGNTAGLSAVLVLSFPSLIVAALVWIAVRLLTGLSFTATRITFIVFPLVFWAFSRSPWFFALGVGLSTLFLAAQRRVTDDHELIKERWPSLWSFLRSPPRK